MSGLRGKAALVTGASRGIGAAVAERLAAEGASVAVNFRADAAAAARVVEACRRSGGEAEAFGADVAVEAEVERLFEAVLARFGRVDILVANAGIHADGLAAAMPTEDFDRVVATNLRGTFLLCRRAAREMLLARAGRIVALSSVVAARGGRGKANYVASKAGIEGFVRALALELAPKGVTVNAVAPGMIETELTEVVRQTTGGEYKKRIPLGRIGSPGDVAGVVAWLVSGDAAYVTGQVITVDGGLGLGTVL